MKKNKINPKALIINVLLTLTEKELLFLTLSSPSSLSDLCVMATLENQMLMRKNYNIILNRLS